MITLKEELENIYRNYTTFDITSDPLEIVRCLRNKKDIEVFAYLASIFSYGSITQIKSTLRKLLLALDSKPYEYLKLNNSFSNVSIKHRFYTEKDIRQLLILISWILNEYDSMYNFFIIGYSDEHKNVKQAISTLSKSLLKIYKRKFGEPSAGIKFMFPLPEKGSACKRINLYLRWMVRKDNLDFGLWSSIPKSKLVIPVDTHIAKISRQLKLTQRKNISWNMAEEITDKLKSLDNEDPVRFDYALCHYDIIRKTYTVKKSA